MSYRLVNKSGIPADINLQDGSRIYLGPGDISDKIDLSRYKAKEYYKNLECVGLFLMSSEDISKADSETSEDDSVEVNQIDSIQVINSEESLAQDENAEKVETVDSLVKDYTKAELIEKAEKLSIEAEETLTKTEIAKLIIGE